ncbi:MAG: class IV adenylate cyclase [Acidobacteriota bacterium]
MPTETEIKLRAPEGAAIAKAHIEALGYQVHTARQLESDTLYDRVNGELRQSDQILRLRMRGDRCTLTYKGPALRAPYKSREEIETDVSDPVHFRLILAALGYQPTFRYEKYRTTYAAGPGLITLDETPVGDYLELEGPAEWIDATALKLGHGMADYVTSSYARLYRDYCKDRPELDPSAMTF